MKAIDKCLQTRRFKMAANEIKSESKILDIGCNNGEFFLFLKKFNIHGVGIDPDPELKDIIVSSNFTFIKSGFPSNELIEKNFDYISFLAVLEHIPLTIQPKFANECFHLLKKNGRLVITVPSPLVDFLLDLLKNFRLIDGMDLHQHFGFKPKSTISLFSKAGFKLVSHKKFQFGLNNLFVFEKPSK